MEKHSKRIDEIRDRLRSLREEELGLEAELNLLEKGQEEEVQRKTTAKLDAQSVRRYSRQLLVPEMGPKGQQRLRDSSVLIIGAGGLGAPCAMYLAAMGVGTLGLVDHDIVDTSNLHRQIIHTEAGSGATSKVVSAKTTLSRLSSLCHVRTYEVLLDRSNALDVMRGYDIVVDASDNAATRYLINDACVLLGTPLVSGSAVRADGQLTVYNYNGGPCYRCMFPKPPPADSVATCSETGVVGVVPGVIGCLQAVETIKVLTGRKSAELHPSLLLFSYGSSSQNMFRSVRLRSRKPTCAVCGDNPAITELADYPMFCGSGHNDAAPSWDIIKDPAHRVTCAGYQNNQSKKHLLLDVRDELEFSICSLPGSVNIPMDEFDRRRQELEETIKKAGGSPVYAVCRRGNLSQLAVRYIRDKIGYSECFDIAGGLLQWQKDIDPEFPAY